MGRFRALKLDSDELHELARLDAWARRVVDPDDRRENMRQTEYFLNRIAEARGLDPYKCTIASDWRGLRVRYEPVR